MFVPSRYSAPDRSAIVVRTEESAVDALPSQVERPLRLTDALTLRGSVGYKAANGLYGGTHYRKERGNGCYHLRIHGKRAWLHWDRWDPGRLPLAHFAETPELVWGAVAVGLVAAGGVAASRSSR